MTWNPADKDPDLNLSAGDRVATAAAAEWNTARAVQSHSAGFRYFEVKVLAGTLTWMTVGVMDALAPVNNVRVGGAATGIGYQNNGRIWQDGAIVQTGLSNAHTVNDVVGVAVDFGANTIAFYRNNFLETTRAIPNGVTFFPAISLFDSDSIEGAFLSADLTYAPPAGATAWGDTAPVTQDATGVAVGVLNWTGEAQSAPATTQDAVAVATGVLNWTGEAQSAAASTQDAVAVATGVLNWTGEAQSAGAAEIATGVATGTIDWTGEAQSAAPPVDVEGTATASINWIGEPESFITPEQQRVIDSGFTGFVILTPAFAAASGLASLSLPYDKSDSETLERRVTTTETNEGAYTFDGGFFEAGRVFSFVIEGASRDQIDTAKAYLKIGLVHISHWDGYYECIMQSVSAPNAELTLEMVVNRKLSDVEAA